MVRNSGEDGDVRDEVKLVHHSSGPAVLQLDDRGDVPEESIKWMLAGLLEGPATKLLADGKAVKVVLYVDHYQNGYFSTDLFVEEVSTGGVDPDKS